MIREYIKKQEEGDKRLERMNCGADSHLQVATPFGAASAAPSAALSGSHLKPPALPGDITELTPSLKTRCRLCRAEIARPH